MAALEVGGAEDQNEKVVSEDLESRLSLFFREAYYKEVLKAAQFQTSLVIDWKELETFDTAIADFFLEKPELVLKAMSSALSNIDVGQALEKPLTIRVKNIPETQLIDIRNLRSMHIGRFVGIKGIIKQASEVRPEITEATFECEVCGRQIKLLQGESTRFRKPFLCECGNKRGFDLKQRKLIDIQRIVVEESPDMIEGGAQPRKISVFLREDLVDPKFQKRVIPGNKVLITGVLSDIPIRTAEGKEESKRRDIYIDGSWLETIETEYSEIEITPQDEKKIKEIARDPNVYELLKKSIAPSIFGYDEIKEAIALQLFGGIRKVRSDGVVTRGDAHIFLVGDPGTAKSQLLNYVSKLAPKARYVVGKSASGAGITATVVRDEFMKGWALEAGALVLANRGLCAIDELDKMSAEDRVAMHEVMEQQTVTISKANVQATLSAQTTILAAANPKFGRFDPYAPIADQIDLPSTLLNRFDLIFPLKDRPDVDRDTRMVRHVLQLHSSPEVIGAPLVSEFLRKYIAYAKANVVPKLTKAAEKAIEQFYVNLRNKYAGEDAPTIPISPRQLEALIRLSEASARIRLSERVTEEDAQRAIRLLTSCLQQVSIDLETGRFDIDKIETGITSTQRNKIRVVLNLVSEMQADSEDKTASIEDIIAAAEEQGIDDAADIIERLKKEGEIFEPRRGRVRRV